MCCPRVTLDVRGDGVVACADDQIAVHDVTSLQLIMLLPNTKRTSRFCVSTGASLPWFNMRDR